MLIMPMKEEDMLFVGDVFCLPMTLIINFSLFQYLATFYFKRRGEVRGMILILCAFGGFASLVPYAHPNSELVGHLNDMSETFSVLTFLIQIVIVGRDVNKKVRIKSLKYVSVAGEVLVIVGLLVVLQNFIEVAVHGIDVSAINGLDNIFEDVALWFIFFARFYYIILSRGVKETLQTRRLDIFFYLLFVTHEYPFVLLQYLTGVSWESPQALWNRLTILFCMVLTIREKMRSISSKQSKMNNTNQFHTTRGPNEKSMYVSDAQEGSSQAPGPSLKLPSMKSISNKVVTTKLKMPSLKSVVVNASVRPQQGK